MTTVATIISDAFRQSNLIPVNGSVTTAQQTEALRHLSRVLDSVFGYEVGEILQDYPIGSKNVEREVTGNPNEYVIPSNKRLVCSLTQNETVYLHPTPRDGDRIAAVDVSRTGDSVLTYNGQVILHEGVPIALNESFPTLTIKGNGRLIDGETEAVLDTAAFNKEWMYRADLGQWIQVSPISSVNNTFPFPQKFDSFFITMLALTLNPAYGAQMDAQTATVFARAKSQLRAQYKSVEEVYSEVADIVSNPSVYVSSDTSFNRGF